MKVQHFFVWWVFLHSFYLHLNRWYLFTSYCEKKKGWLATADVKWTLSKRSYPLLCMLRWSNKAPSSGHNKNINVPIDMMFRRRRHSLFSKMPPKYCVIIWLNDSEIPSNCGSPHGSPVGSSSGSPFGASFGCPWLFDAMCKSVMYV